jgi:hypothetical protein
MTHHRADPRSACAATTARAVSACAVLAMLLLGAAGGVGCRPGIGAINTTPARYHGREVRLYGRIGEVIAPEAPLDPVVFHLVARDGGRIIVVAPGPLVRGQGDWVKVRGQFHPEITVGGRAYYDVVVATSIRRARAPLLPRIF